MIQAPSDLEVELLARELKRDEQARQILQSGPIVRLWRYIGAPIAMVVGIQFLERPWKDLPANLGAVVAGLVCAFVWQSAELHQTRRRLDAVIRLLRLPKDESA